MLTPYLLLMLTVYATVFVAGCVLIWYRARAGGNFHTRRFFTATAIVGVLGAALVYWCQPQPVPRYVPITEMALSTVRPLSVFGYALITGREDPTPRLHPLFVALTCLGLVPILLVLAAQRRRLRARLDLAAGALALGLGGVCAWQLLHPIPVTDSTLGRFPAPGWVSHGDGNCGGPYFVVANDVAHDFGHGKKLPALLIQYSSWAPDGPGQLHKTEGETVWIPFQIAAKSYRYKRPDPIQLYFLCRPDIGTTLFSHVTKQPDARVISEANDEPPLPGQRFRLAYRIQPLDRTKPEFIVPAERLIYRWWWEYPPKVYPPGTQAIVDRELAELLSS